ncbi:SDR family oxidoreductase [Rathayibacter tritici]|uniref:Oxidoreductase n=1 Tax=Rathayibacter tritici TaxID=33888 RepID=A0A160KQ06_9MICO|nr:SDR family oxidoreductase [Rathayibacter tritici]AND15277.1 oxidoreductase [Rathayibacter tritici]PPF22811.1 NAD(P)-dependent oxidoreductase [Rathayibacter tritici]PPI10818.1 NAD(P)-dependent oxidoreductase [Rathayibacter tritici]PPI47745.1 NAD(P)-dependent oxidoreductase [Rathayibacter tritici]
MTALIGKVAMITGAARGVGRATAVRFAEQGADVVLVDVARDIEGVPYALGTRSQLDETERLCRKSGAGVLVRVADVRDSEAVNEAVAAGIGRFGAIDALVNCAGIASPSGRIVHEISDAEWDLMIDIDLTGAFRAVRAVGAHMAARRSGSIVNVSSTAGMVGYRNFSGYVSAKHGLVGFSKAAALDYAPFKVRVNALCPGSVRDDALVEGAMLVEIARQLDVPTSEHEQIFVQSQPMNALIEPSDVAEAAVWLASDASRNVTGTSLTVDGGFTAR